MSTANDIEAQAMQWLLRLEAADSANAETLQAQFDTWCKDDSRHHVAYIRLRKAWRKADQLKRLAGHDGIVDPDLLAPARRSIQAKIFSGWRLAAVFALVFAGIVAWWQ